MVDFGMNFETIWAHNFMIREQLIKADCYA